jgi:hypothetical protein
VHGDPADVVAVDLELARMQPDPDIDPERVDVRADPLAQRIARAGPSKVARNPSPVVRISRPR